MATNHDLIVLGAGSGGLATAFRAAEHGARVALVDPAALGGTCVHRGCVPKKALWYAAQWAQAQEFAVTAGFNSTPGTLDWERFRGIRQGFIDRIEQSYGRRLPEAGVEVVRQSGRFVATDVIELTDGKRLRAAQIVVATGARPRTLDVPGFDLGLVSDGMFALASRPQRMAIVGGGYVAVEFAGLLNALGSEVEVFAHGRLLEGFDAELTQALQQQMQAQGIRINLKSAVQALRRDASGLVVDDGISGSRGPYDALLWAVGRVPNTELLGLPEVGVATDERGHILVDDRQDTNVAGIHALGDVTSRKALTPVAVAAGRHLADRLFGGRTEAQLDYENIPSVVFAEPPVGMVGLTEEAARAEHGDAVKIHCSRFTPMQWALVGKQEKSLMKLVCVGEEERVLGIHLLGPGADEMLQGFAVALKMGLHKRDLDATVAIHPSSAEELVLMS
ncbi:MAG: glutathione-disulfide reductase [Rhodanobacter sp.]